jgi:hypothetical protein
VWRLCVEVMCGGYVWRLCVEVMCGGYVKVMCESYVCECSRFGMDDEEIIIS